MGDVEQTLQGAVHKTSVTYVLQPASALRRELIFQFQIEIIKVDLERGLTEEQVPLLIFLLALFGTVRDLVTLALEFQSFYFNTSMTFTHFVNSTVKLEYELTCL